MLENQSIFEPVDCNLSTEVNPNQPIESRKRLSCPSAGRTLGGVVSRFNKPIQKVVSTLEDYFYAKRYQPVFFDPVDRVGEGCTGDDKNTRLAWFLVNVFLTYKYVHKGTGNRFSSALRWFYDDEIDLTTFTDSLDLDRLSESLSSICDDEDLIDLLPYLLEPHGHITRRELETCDFSKNVRNNKKGSGVFYTPSDVADFMVDSTVNLGQINGRWIDPACGTGVFLRSILKHTGLKGARLLQFFRSNVFGIDKCVVSTDSCAFVLLADIINSGKISLSAYHIWKTIKDNLYATDTLNLVSNHTIVQDLFSQDTSEPWWKCFNNLNDGHFDYVIMNPPYASTELSQSLRNKWSVFSHKSANSKGETHLAFIEMMTGLLKEHGVGCAVMPLSFASNTSKSFKKIRNELESLGSLHSLFFDREPQSLFGEDIKTRSAISFFKKSSNNREIYTSRLLKWRSAKRESIFRFDRQVKIDGFTIRDVIPKLGCASEVNTFKSLKKIGFHNHSELARVTYDEILKNRENYQHCVFISGTAYNYINIFFESGLPPIDESISLSGSPLIAASFSDAKSAFAFYALLSSKLSFWLWHAVGDGFHVTSAFIKSIPYVDLLKDDNAMDKLSTLGQAIWLKTKNKAVKSLNGGKTTYSFHDTFFNSNVEAIDNLILKKINAPQIFSKEVGEIIADAVSVQINCSRTKQ